MAYYVKANDVDDEILAENILGELNKGNSSFKYYIEFIPQSIFLGRRIRKIKLYSTPCDWLNIEIARVTTNPKNNHTEVFFPEHVVLTKDLVEKIVEKCDSKL